MHYYRYIIFIKNVICTREEIIFYFISMYQHVGDNFKLKLFKSSLFEVCRLFAFANELIWKKKKIYIQRFDCEIILSLPSGARIPFHSLGSNGIKRSSRRRSEDWRLQRDDRGERLVAGNVRIVRCSQFYSEQLCNVGADERMGEEKINGINEPKKKG